VGVKWSGIYF